MMKRVALSGACAIALIMVGCEQVSNEQIGTIGGVGAGAAVGSIIGEGAGRVAATAGGAVIGGLVGREIGKYLDEQDQEKLS
mgnify:CR=1 FL=1